MSIRPEVQKIFDDIWEEAGYPPISLITETEYKRRTGCSIPSGACASSYYSEKIFCIRQNYNLKEIKDSIWHEILHCLYQNMPEWWVECAAYKLSKNDRSTYGAHAEIRNKTPADIFPSRKILIELIRDTSKELNEDIQIIKG